MLHAVIMAGGSGTRFWPASRSAFPKQLLTLTGGESLLQATLARIEPVIPPERTLIVTSASHAGALREQAPRIPVGNILVEPCARNTAPCIGLAAIQVRSRDPEGAMVCMPSDHVIADRFEWTRLLEAAGTLVARPGPVLVFGIPPTRPETGFGYIRFGPSVEPGAVASAAQGPALPGQCEVRRVLSFTEKPDEELARKFLASGDYYWNSGLAAWRADTCLELIERHLPATRAGLERIAAAIGTDRYDRVLEEVYPALESISIDYGVLERAEDILGITAGMGWSDVGSWSALPEVSEADRDGNVGLGEHVAIESRGCVTYAAPGQLVATLGVDDLIVVAAGDAILVCPRERAQDVKKVVDALRARGDERYL